jgi:hypothetical protein
MTQAEPVLSKATSVLLAMRVDRVALEVPGPESMCHCPWKGATRFSGNCASEKRAGKALAAR